MNFSMCRTREIQIDLKDAKELVVGLPVDVMIKPKPKHSVLD